MVRHGITGALVSLATFLLFAGGCGEDIAGLSSLTVRAEVAPDRVAPGDSLVARAILTNYGSDKVLVLRGCPGLGWPHVFRAGETVAMEGASVGPPNLVCLLSAHQPDTIPPGGSMTLEWPMSAVVGGAPAPPGEYLFRFEATYERLSAAEAPFTIE